MRAGPTLRLPETSVLEGKLDLSSVEERPGIGEPVPTGPWIVGMKSVQVGSRDPGPARNGGENGGSLAERGDLLDPADELRSNGWIGPGRDHPLA